MTRLILTTSDSGAGCLMQAGAAEIVIPFCFRFAWGRLPSAAELASLAWQAYRQPTPQDWFDLLGRDLSVLPQLRQAALELLEELPMSGAGIGATEMRMLELISAGNAGPFDVFAGHRKPTNDVS